MKATLIFLLSLFLIGCGGERPLTKEEKEILKYQGKQGLQAYRRAKYIKAPKGSTMDLLDKAEKMQRKSAKTMHKLKRPVKIPLGR